MSPSTRNGWIFFWILTSNSDKYDYFFSREIEFMDEYEILTAVSKITRNTGWGVIKLQGFIYQECCYQLCSLVYLCTLFYNSFLRAITKMFPIISLLAQSLFFCVSHWNTDRHMLIWSLEAWMHRSIIQVAYPPLLYYALWPLVEAINSFSS